MQRPYHDYKSPASLYYKVYASLKEQAANWDKLLPELHHMRSEHLLALEQCKPADLEFAYLFFYKNDIAQPVACAYFQLVHFTTRHYQFPLWSNAWLAPLEKMVLRNGFHILVCGNLFRVDFPAIHIADMQVSLTELFDTLEIYYKKLQPQPHAILIKDCRSGTDTTWVKQFNFRNWPEDLTMKLDLNPAWKSLSDYTAALKHKYAQRVRKIQRSAASIARRNLAEEEIKFYGDELEQLFYNVVRQQAIRLVIPDKSYFLEMKKSYGEAFQLTGYFEGEKLVAFSSHFIYEETWELHYIGMDYAKNEQYLLYFNMMYDGIAMAITNKKKAVELGRTAREAKSMLGGKPIYFTSYYRLRGWLVNKLVAQFAHTFNEKTGESWHVRSPMKKK